MWIFAVLCIILVIILIVNNIKGKKPTTTIVTTETIEKKTEEKIETEKLPYSRKNLLTKNEWSFYKQLKPIADKLNLHILSKVRLADLVEVKKGLNNSEWQTAFNRINKKHIDFILCNPENLYPLLLIELDDSSHQQEKQKERDAFVKSLYEKTGYKLLRVSGAGNIEEKICTELNIQPPTSELTDNLKN